MENIDLEYDDTYDNCYKFPQMEMKENEIYLWAKNQIDKKGYICELYDDYHKMKFSKDTDFYNMYFDDKYKEINFYNAELYTAFAYGGFSLEAYKENSKIDINNEIYFFKAYKGAYIKGVKDFDKDKKEALINGNQELFLFLKGWLKQCKYIFSKRVMINIYSMGENGRYAGVFSRIIEIITKNIILQQQIKDLASDDLVLQQRIEKIISNYRPLQPITIYDENDNFFNEDENEETKTKPPQKNFENYILCKNKETLLSKLHELLDGSGSGKEIGTIISALQVENKLSYDCKTPTIIEHFNITCSKQAINNYILHSKNPEKIKEKPEIIQYIDIFKDIE